MFHRHPKPVAAPMLAREESRAPRTPSRPLTAGESSLRGRAVLGRARVRSGLGLAALLFWLSALAALFGEEPQEPPALEKELLWDKSFNLRAGFGFKDNVLLSPNREQASAFASAGFDAMVFRLPIDGLHVLLFLTAEDLRYLGEVGVDKEQTLIALAKVEKELGQDWSAGSGLQYFFQNQVFDVSATEAELTTLQLKGHGIRVAPFLTRSLSKTWQLSLETPITRQYLAEPLDDYWEGGPKLTIERKYAQSSSVALSYAYERRHYDKRRATDARGALVPGTALAFRAHEFELAHRHAWDAQRRWRTDGKLGVELNADNGSGFFDYRRFHLACQLRYSAKAWNARAQARANFYDYSLQPAGPGAASTRRLTTFTITARAERALTKNLKLFAEYEHEQTLSNRASNEYGVHTLLAGLDWEL